MKKGISQTAEKVLKQPRRLKDKKISKQEIRQRAYELYLNREPHSGTPEEDWFRAEEELYSDPGH